MMARLESKLDACLEIMEAHEVETMRAPENWYKDQCKAQQTT
jgi:hypothetical protein